MIVGELDGSAHQRPVRRMARWQPAVENDIDMKSDGSSDSEESSDDVRPSLGVRMRTADPRYITHADMTVTGRMS
jgi:hypothetical protein